MYESKAERVKAVAKHAPTRKYLDGLNRKALYTKIADLAVQICSLKSLIDKAEGRERVARAELAEMKAERDKLAAAVEMEQRIVARMMIRNLELSGKV